MVPILPTTLPVVARLKAEAVTPVTALLNTTSKLSVEAALNAPATWRVIEVTVGAGTV